MSYRCDNLGPPGDGQKYRIRNDCSVEETEFFIGLKATGWVLPPVVRRGETVCPGREAGRRASAAGPWMAHRRVPWDKRVSRGNPTQEGEQAGEKTFGDFGSFQSHSPSRAAAAKPRRGQRPRVLHGEAMQIRRVTPHPNPLPQGERGRLLRTITLR